MGVSKAAAIWGEGKVRSGPIKVLPCRRVWSLRCWRGSLCSPGSARVEACPPLLRASALCECVVVASLEMGPARPSRESLPSVSVWSLRLWR